MRRMYSENQLLKAIEKESQENGLKVFENIVDKDGHARFQEFDLSTKTITGMSFTYHKIGLSGSHLLIVLAGKIDNGSALSSENIAYWYLPKWISDKIVPVAPNNTYIESKTITAYSDNFATTQTFRADLRIDKSNENTPILQIDRGSFTASADRYYRIAFDLLIDNE